MNSEKTIVPYDSTADTLAHIRSVSVKLNDFAIELMRRGNVHDESKLHSPEKELFDELTPILKGLEYGSPEYKESLTRLDVALRHHYENNGHHPQHYENGIDGMTLYDLVEMFCDWHAATERTKNGSLKASIKINEERFKMSSQLTQIFLNTANYVTPFDAD